MAAMFVPNPTLREVCLWRGYMKAGAALIDEALRQTLHRDLLLYPILFNYRHGLEAAMKWIIGNVEREKRDRHDLLALWGKCRMIFESVPEFDGDEELEAVEQIIKELHAIDEFAASFRYSRKQNGAVIPLPDESIDLQNVRDVMEMMDNFFHEACDIVFTQTEEGPS
jgi:hypothetical protein